MADRSHFPRVLLAEDNRLYLRVLQLMVQQLGFTADTVDNGAAAVEAVKQSVYGVVLMDIAMPMMDGLEATRQIRAHFGSQRRPYIIAVTASDEREIGLAAGMDAYITKPVRLIDLPALLAEALVVGGEWQENQRATPAGEVR